MRQSPVRPFVTIRRRVFRIGVQWLFRDATGQLFTAIQNRSYKSCVAVPEDSLQRRIERFDAPRDRQRRT